MGKVQSNGGIPNPLPESCRTCTSYLNQTLPKPSCYTFCPKNDPIQEIESSLNLNASRNSALKWCPKCHTQTLFWNKSQLVYECLVCKGTYTIKALKIAQLNAENERKHTGYLHAGDGYDA